MAVNSPGGYPPVSPKPHTPKSPRHFVFPQKSPSIASSTSSSGYYTPQSGCSYDKYNQPPKSPVAHGHRSPLSPRHFNFSQKSPSGRSSPSNFDRISSHALSYSNSLKHNRREKSRSPKPPPVHIHTNPGYVSPNRNRRLFGSTSTVNSPRMVTSPSIVSSHTDDSTDVMPGTPSAFVHDADDEATSISSRICRKSTSDLTDFTDDTPQTRSTSLSRPCSPMRRGSMKGGLAYLASRRGSRESNVSNCDSVEDIGPLNFQNTVRGRQRRTSNFLELPVVDHSRPRVCSLPEKPYNPRLSDDLYRLRTFSITTKGGVVNCGDSICNRRSRSNTSVNSTNSRASDRSPFEGSCCSGYRPVDSASLTTPEEDELEPIQKHRVVLLGDSGVGKTALVSQFMTSEYMNTYDASLDDEFGEKSVSVLLDGEESELIFIDHPSTEMSVENCMSTYEPHACVIVYSVVAKSSFTRAAELLAYLAREQFTSDRTVVLVGNKADLARARQVSTNEGKALATTRDCKFIETSSGIQHNVDELLVGILKQIRLKDNRDKKASKKELLNKATDKLENEVDEINMSCENESLKNTETDLELVITETEDNMLPGLKLVMENEIKDQKFTTNGNRIIDFGYMYEQLVEISNHNPAFGCTLSCLKLTKEVKKGFLSKFFFTCQMCNVKLNIMSCKNPNNPTDLDLNENVVSSFMSIGAGFSALEQVSASVNIPCMSDKLYAKCHTKVCALWELAKEKIMEEAAKEESELAILNGDVDEQGVPMITVVADACWSKRSYRKNYNALSGAAVIIGYRTQKVLYMAVKNKYCMVCARAENKKQKIPDHICFKNYTGSSSGMESSALVEGFKTSKGTHGLIYSRLIADGDASTHRNIEKAKPYGKLLVEKIECTNHLLRNYCTKLDELARNTSYPLKYRRILQNNILRLRRSVTGAVYHIDSQNDKTFAEKVLELKKDLLNAPNHVFGDHRSCKLYYCKTLTQGESNTGNLANEMKSKEGGFIFLAILKFTSRLVNNATSLMHNVNSNIAEVFNSVVAKFIGGKRINYSGRQSYSGRCAASVVSFNSKNPQTYVNNKILLKSPNKLIKRLENKRNIKRLASAKRQIYKSFSFISKKPAASHNDKNYGESCEKPDLAEADFNFSKAEHLKNITLSDEERHSLERRTILQAESIEWRQERKLRITASVFGKVCKRGTIKCGPLVKHIVTEKNLDHVKSIQHGQSHEHLARDQLQKYLNTPVKTCRLFIDPDLPFLGASPDGLVEEDKIVEIKCPYSARGISVDNGIKEKKIVFWKLDIDGNINVNKKHDWYYQIQGQLHITRRKLCIFACWTDVDMKVEFIYKDDEFWNSMEYKLKTFYFDCLLPEIIDSRLDRQMEIKEPKYILEAIKKRENEKRKIVQNKTISAKRIKVDV